MEDTSIDQKQQHVGTQYNAGVINIHNGNPPATSPAPLPQQPSDTDTTAKPPRVFISHSSRDKDFVRKLKADLDAQKLDVWVDEQRIDVGGSIVEGVSEGLRDTDYFVLVISENSLSSRWVQQEYNSAMMSELSGKGVIVLPIRIDDAPLPPLLMDRIYADFRTDYDKGLKDLLAVFRQETTGVVSNPNAPQTSSGQTSCSYALQALKEADLRRRINKRLSFDEIKVVWWSTFNDDLDSVFPNLPRDNCTVKMIERAKQRSLTDDLLDNLCSDYPHIANP